MSVPMFLYLRFPTGGGSFGMWLPWFLIYPIVLALMLLVLPFVLVAAIILLPLGKAQPVIMAGPYLWRLLFAMGGLRVDVKTGVHEVQLNFV